jgi:hypothetical protein
MSAAEYNQLSPKNNWTLEVKKVPLQFSLAHFAVGVVHALKVYGQYGQLTKRYEMGCKVINYGLAINRVVIEHKKLGGQRLCLLNREMLQSWMENFCDNFSGNDTERYFQGDGNAPIKIVKDGTSGGVPAHDSRPTINLIRFERLRGIHIIIIFT